MILDHDLGFSDKKLERMTYRPFFEKGLARWKAWESERTGFGLGFRFAAGYPLFLPLFFTSDHYTNPITELRENEISGRFGAHLVWYGPKASLLRNQGVTAYCVPHPWKFLPLPKKEWSEGRGTLYFLPHGHPGIEIEPDWKALRSELEGLPEMYHPISVCLGAYEFVGVFTTRSVRGLAFQ